MAYWAINHHKGEPNLLDDNDKQFLEEMETRLLRFMGQRFDASDKRLEAIEATLSRLDRSIGGFHYSMGAIQTQQADWERMVRDLLRRVEALERKAG